jgi:hypothetical protein
VRGYLRLSLVSCPIYLSLATTRTIVIGAGVMGASVTYRLARPAAVTVLEATRIGGGTSGSSFPWTNAHKKPPKAYHDLNVAGLKAHAALADEFGATPWWHGGGSLEWEAEPDRTAQRENIEQLRSWGYAAAAGGCGFASLPPDRTPGRHFTRVFCINGGSDEGIQINSGRHTQESKIIGAGKIYNIFLPFATLLHGSAGLRAWAG